MMAMLPFVALSCAPEEVHQAGEPDLENCYGVYFPTQDATGSHALDPSDPKSVEFVVKRLTKEDEISVPVVVTASHEGIFEVSELLFDDGQAETTIEVTFENAEQGVQYTLDLAIDDPQYALVYGTNPVSLRYSVIIERYDFLGTALYREDCLSTFFPVGGVEWEVEVYTKETKKGCYYLKNLYQPGVTPLIDATDENGNPLPQELTYLEIDATDPAKVHLPLQMIGLDVGYGGIAIGSYNELNGFSQSNYGTLKDNIIEFPEGGLVVGMENYENFGFYLANSSGIFRVALPGAVLTDYTISMAAGYATDGQQPVQFTFGKDVKTIKYAAFEGALNAGAIAEKVREVKKDENAAVLEQPAADAEGNIPPVVAALSFETTGEYTVVAVGYDAEGTAQSEASLAIQYVAAGEEVPVVIKAGLASAEKYVPLGYSPETAVEFYLYGQDLVDLKVGVFSAAELADTQACLAAVQESDSVSPEILEAVNTEVYVDVITGLTPGTEYYMLVWASNGYEQTAFLTNSQTTAGDPLPVYASYTMDDINLELLPATSEGYFGEYNYYANDFFGDSPLRQYLGSVKITDSDVADLPADDYGYVTEYVKVQGMFAGEGAYYGFDDTMDFEYYGGVLYQLPNYFLNSTSGYHFAVMYLTESDQLYGHANSYTMLGGFVSEGYLAFVDATGSYGFNGWFLRAFEDEACATAVGNVSCYQNVLLVDPAVDDNGLAPEAAAQSEMSRSDLSKLQFNIANEYNCVETERGRIHSLIDRMNAEKAPEMEGHMAGIKGEWDAPAVDVQVEVISGASGFDNDYFTQIRNVGSPIYR